VTKDLPYRRSAGVALLNRDGAVFIGRRKKSREAGLVVGHEWQMPQGGIDDGEAPFEAALRELFEETNVSSASLIAEAPQWLSYDLPDNARGRWRGRYRGQTQKWFLLRFEGEDSEIDIERPGGGGHTPEFDAWRWERLEALPDLVVPFKRRVYEGVVAAFAPLARPK
jgi:putative (di)nucleoside polyphosphate hydrolase